MFWILSSIAFFIFSIFQTFGNIGNVSDKLLILSELHYFLVNILTQYKTDLKQLLQCRHTRYIDDMYLWLHKVLLSKSEELLS